MYQEQADATAIRFSLPPEAEAALKERGVAGLVVEAVIETDLTLEGRPGRSWLVITDQALFAVHPDRPEETRVAGPLPFGKIEKIRIFRGVGSNFLQVRTEGLFVDMVRFSNALLEEFNRARLHVDRVLAKKTGGRGLFTAANPWLCAACGLALPGRGAVCPRCAREHGLFLRTLMLMRPYAGFVALLIGMMLAGVALDLLPPYLTRILVDDVLTTRRKTDLLVGLVLSLAGASMLRAVLNIFIGRVSTSIGTRVTYELRSRLHRKLADLSLDFHHRSVTGNLITRLLHDVDYFHGFVQQVAQGFFVNIVLIAGIGLMLFHLNPALACYVLIPIPFVVAGTWFFWHIIYPRYFRYWDSQSKLAALLTGMLAGIRTVKAYAQEAREHLRFSNAAGTARDARRDVDKSTTTFFPIFGFVFGLGGLIVWYAGGRQVLGQELTLGTLMAFLGYLGMFYSPISALTMFSNWLTGFLTAGQRIFEILDTPVTLPVPASPVRKEKILGRIEFNGVTFGYDPYQPVIKGVTLTIEPGQTVGLVGKSGCGKTTLVNLLCRFYDPQEGRILIDGTDVRDMDNADLRRHTGLVLQEPFLFRATIAENIAYGRPDATPADILNASKAANCHPFILRTPGAYDTRLGERGEGLSGGERQRVSVARAFLCDPAILILDEATSSVDTEAEQEIQKALAVLSKGRTSIIIAHRLMTLKNADVIYVMDDGKIVEQGSHAELMEKKGHYHKLVMIQASLAKIEDK